MEGFNENDTIPSFNSSELIEEIIDNDGNGKDDEKMDDEDIGEDDDDSVCNDSSSSSLDPYEGTPKRFKKAVINKNSFKHKVMQILLQSCEVAGDFAVSGKLESTPLVAISLKNRGGADECIKFPLQDHEVAKILKYFEPSPYGKGTKTIVDSTVRNSFQLSPGDFEILNSDWDKFIKTTLVNRIKKEMSLESCSFVPSLYKLLLYQPGSFFKSHRDSEKEDNMFGTLVVQLPSKFKGGQLIVRHDGRSKLFDFSSTAASVNNSFSSFFSAFYCDCEHEILPVTDGYRLCLVYNLITIGIEIPLAPENHALEQELIRLLQNWEGVGKIVYGLTHKYSEANLSFKNLKTTDKIVANILKRVSAACDLNIFLALFDKNCTGDDPDGCEDDDCHGCASDFDGDFDGECDEVSYTLNSLIPDGNDERIAFTNWAVHFKKEVIPINCFDSISPHQQDCEHTGNEGVHITKSYRCAAITFWPKKVTFQVLKTSNAPQKLIDAFFIKEAEKYFDPNCDAETKVKILQWPRFIATQKRYDLAGVVPVINTVIKFNDIDLIKKLIENGVVRSPEAFCLIVKECDKFGWEYFATSTVAMFKHLEQKAAIKILNLFFGDENLNQEKSKVFVALLQAIIDKGPASSTYYYSTEGKAKQQKEERDSLEPLVHAMLKFNDLQLIQSFVKCILPFHSETILLLSLICQTYGWEPFATTIADKFKTASKKDQVFCLTSIIQNGVLKDDEKTLCRNLFGVMFDKNENLTIDSFPVATDIVKRRKEEKEFLEPLLHAASIFNDVQLIKCIFQRMPLHSETISLLFNQSQIFGWNAFATEISSKFEKLSQIDAIDSLSMLIGMGNFKAERILCFNLFQTVLGKTHLPPSNNMRRITQEAQSKYLKEKQDILYSICCVAENIKFNLIVFAKTKSFKDFVPVLLRLVHKQTNRLSPFWGAIGLHFIAEMGKESIKPIEISWKHDPSSLFACCMDCHTLNNFLESNKERESFRMGEKRRKHLQQRIDNMAKLSHRIESGVRGQSGVLVVTKTEMGGFEAEQDKTLSRTLLERLRLVMPYN